MKVSIIAIDNVDIGYDTHLPQFQINIQTTLEYVVQLLSFEEMECLEEVIKVYDTL